MIEQLIREIVNLKWYVVIYAVFSVAFCAAIYLSTKEFNWSFKRIRAFAVLYNLNANGRVAVGLLLGRLIYVFCMAVFGGSDGLWDAFVLLIYTIAICISARNVKELLQILSYGAIFAISVMENMFIQYYKDVESNRLILIVAVLFGFFIFLYSGYQTMISYNNLLTVSARTDKKLFDKDFYEKANGTNQL